jgi:hypothetical protein
MADIIVMKPAIQHAKQDSRMEETAKLLVDTGIRTLMQLYGTDRETARRLVVSAGEALDAE